MAATAKPFLYRDQLQQLDELWPAHGNMTQKKSDLEYFSKRADQIRSGMIFHQVPKSRYTFTSLVMELINHENVKKGAEEACTLYRNAVKDFSPPQLHGLTLDYLSRMGVNLEEITTVYNRVFGHAHQQLNSRLKQMNEVHNLFCSNLPNIADSIEQIGILVELQGQKTHIGLSQLFASTPRINQERTRIGKESAKNNYTIVPRSSRTQEPLFNPSKSGPILFPFLYSSQRKSYTVIAEEATAEAAKCGQLKEEKSLLDQQIAEWSQPNAVSEETFKTCIQKYDAYENLLKKCNSIAEIYKSAVQMLDIPPTLDPLTLDVVKRLGVETDDSMGKRCQDLFIHTTVGSTYFRTNKQLTPFGTEFMAGQKEIVQLQADLSVSLTKLNSLLEAKGLELQKKNPSWGPKHGWVFYSSLAAWARGQNEQPAAASTTLATQVPLA